MTDTTTGDLESAVESMLSRYRAPVIAEMRAAVDRSKVEHMRYARYHLGWEDAEGGHVEVAGGKMLRPAILLLCCESVGGDAAQAMPAAAAIELLHNFSLIHDDIEDRSEIRHGRPTLWTVAGIEQAINAGDGLFALAQRTLLDVAAAGVEAPRALRAATLLNDACIALCEGQYADLTFESRDEIAISEYEAMIGGKTASLVGASAAIGAVCGGATDGAIAAFARWGMLLGMAFQVRDDLLGIWGDPALTGKAAADDVRARKKSFPVACAMQHLGTADRAEFMRLYGDRDNERAAPRIVELIEHSGARELAEQAAAERARDAMRALEPIELQADRREEMRMLASYVVQRRR